MGARGTHGSISWYGPVNQAGLVAQLTVVLGIRPAWFSPEIDPAIARAANFFSYYVNRGSIPYGEHQPYYGEHQLPRQSRMYYDHYSNGKNGLTAVMFAYMGNRPAPAEYFTRMASRDSRARPTGIRGRGSATCGRRWRHVGGTQAVAEYLKKLRWHRDLKRRLDGSFVYEGGEQWAPGRGNDYWDYSSTYYDNPTAYYLLHAAIPRKQLYITGKNANPTNHA